MESYIRDVDILDESKEAFLTYAEEVLTDRAIPSIEDGLLSVQRKIIWTMEEPQGMNFKSKFKKSANIVGTTMATSYFHGDASCYNALCKMSQEYLMRYPLVKGEGSLGTQEANDMQASARYTNAKPNIYADLMMNDYKKNVVPVKATYNNEYMEPVVLPSLFPNALVNGREAIGVSMAHNSLPMNLTEVCNAIIKYINLDGNVTVEDLMECIKGPDFPLGGTVMNSQDILHAYKTGKSVVSIKVRGDYEIEDNKIIFTSIPYRTYRNKIKEQIAKNVDELDEYIEDFNDESNVGMNRLVFFVRKNIDVMDAVEALCKYTDLQTTLSYNMNFIVNGTPKLCSLYDLVHHYVRHQTEVLINATTYDLNKEEKELHILRGLLIILQDLDSAITIIRNSADKEEAAEGLKLAFKVDDVQAEAILNMKLSRLTKLESEQIEKKIYTKEELVAEYKAILEDEDYRNKVLIGEIENMRDKYGDERRTKLLNIDMETKTTKSKAKAEKKAEPVMVIFNLDKQTIKKMTPDKYKEQPKGSITIRTDTLKTLTMFTNMNRTLKVKVKDVPNGTNTSIGSFMKDIIELPFNEKILVVREELNDNHYLLTVTKNGLGKKTPMSEYESIRGGKTTKVKDEDELIHVSDYMDGNVFFITTNGRILKLNKDSIPDGKKTTLGNKIIKLDEDDNLEFVLPIPSSSAQTFYVTLEDGTKSEYNGRDFDLGSRNTKGRKLIKSGRIVNVSLE